MTHLRHRMIEDMQLDEETTANLLANSALEWLAMTREQFL